MCPAPLSVMTAKTANFYGHGSGGLGGQEMTITSIGGIERLETS
jgi:hypothetical protein